MKKREGRLAILFVYWKIVLRLNRIEPSHELLRVMLFDLFDVQERVPNRQKIEAAVDLARRILKREWDVTKYGALTDIVLKCKELWSRVRSRYRRPTRIEVTRD